MEQTLTIICENDEKVSVPQCFIKHSGHLSAMLEDIPELEEVPIGNIPKESIEELLILSKEYSGKQIPTYEDPEEDLNDFDSDFLGYGDGELSKLIIHRDALTIPGIEVLEWFENDPEDGYPTKVKFTDEYIARFRRMERLIAAADLLGMEFVHIFAKGFACLLEGQVPAIADEIAKLMGCEDMKALLKYKDM